MNRNKFLKAISIVMCLLLALGCLSGCGASDAVDKVTNVVTNDYPVTIGETTIGSKPTNAVVLSAKLADAILAMGYEVNLAAVTSDCTQSDYDTLTKVDAADIQSVIGLSPDLIIAEELDQSAADALTEAGITYVNLSPAKNREDFERLYSELGLIFGGSNSGADNGIAVAQNIFTSLDDLARIIPDNNVVVTACYLYDTEGQAVTGDQLASVIMTYAGITNVFQGSSGGTYDYDNLKITDPDIIFCPVGMKDTIMSTFYELSAVHEGRVYELDASLVQWQGRTVVTMATTMAGFAYPELLEENTATVSMEEPVVSDEVSEESEDTEDRSDEESSDESSKEESSKDESSDEESSKDESSDESSDDKTESSKNPTDDIEGLKLGDQSDEVYNVQFKLSELGYLPDSFDGYFGEVTEAAVKAFQKANDLPETGVVDDATYDKLFSGDVVAAN